MSSMKKCPKCKGEKYNDTSGLKEDGYWIRIECVGCGWVFAGYVAFEELHEFSPIGGE